MTEVVLTKAKTQFAVCAAVNVKQSQRSMQVSTREVGWAIDGHGPAGELSVACPSSFASPPLGEVELHDFQRAYPWF